MSNIKYANLYSDMSTAFIGKRMCEVPLLYFSVIAYHIQRNLSQRFNASHFIFGLTFFCQMLFFIGQSFAQKNVVSVKISGMSGIPLPMGSKQDKRILATASGSVFLELQSKKYGYSVEASEVFYLPAISLSKYNMDSLFFAIKAMNWNIVTDTIDKHFAYLQKGDIRLIVFFENLKDKTNLYFGELSAINKTQVKQSETIKSAETNSVTINSPTISQKQIEEKNVINKNSSAFSGKYAFTTTNWDDGWLSNVEEDWVRVTKGNITVLLHYPSNKEDKMDLNIESSTRSAWNIYVASRYKNLKDFFILTYHMDFEPAHYASGYVTDVSSGKTFFVALFSKAKSGWIECIAPDRSTFESIFGIDQSLVNQTYYSWGAIQKMAGYNRFGVSASDLFGVWKNDFSGITQYVSVYTGQSAGADTHTSRETYQFYGNALYTWELGVANGFVGNIKFQTVKSSGAFNMNGVWQIHLSDIESKPRDYPVYFSCLKGTRILFINGTAFGRAN